MKMGELKIDLDQTPWKSKVSIINEEGQEIDLPVMEIKVVQRSRALLSAEVTTLIKRTKVVLKFSYDEKLEKYLVKIK